MRARPAFAKVNLALEITGKRPDGYHDLDSIVTSIDWHDLVAVDLEPATKTTVQLRVRGSSSEIPCDENNLAFRAARDLAATTGREWRIAVDLDKRLPSGAGLGGGSSNAATVLAICAELMNGHGAAIPSGAIKGVAEQLGSDVPVLLHPGTYRVRGRGEILDCLPPAELWLVVAVLGNNQTAAVYPAVRSTTGEGRAERLAASLFAREQPAVNDLGSALEAPAAAVYPEFATTLSQLRRRTPDQHWAMTGSGGAVFAIAADREDAKSLARHTGELGFATRVCRTVTSA